MLIKVNKLHKTLQFEIQSDFWKGVWQLPDSGSCQMPFQRHKHLTVRIGGLAVFGVRMRSEILKTLKETSSYRFALPLFIRLSDVHAWFSVIFSAISWTRFTFLIVLPRSKAGHHWRESIIKLFEQNWVDLETKTIKKAMKKIHFYE